MLLAGAMALQQVTGTLPVASLPLAAVGKMVYGLRRLPERQPQQTQTGGLRAGRCLPCHLLTACWWKTALSITEVLTLQLVFACCASGGF